jgi:hypothetical protein
VSPRYDRPINYAIRSFERLAPVTEKNHSTKINDANSIFKHTKSGAAGSLGGISAGLLTQELTQQHHLKANRLGSPTAASDLDWIGDRATFLLERQRPQAAYPFLRSELLPEGGVCAATKQLTHANSLK